MLILMGYIHLEPSDVETFAADIRAIGAGTRAEEGCLFYAVTLDDRAIGRFLVAQRWRDEQALTSHLERLETQAFLKTWKDRMRGDFQTYEVLNESRPG